ncbi:MAG: flagellar basal body P-ring protein FlgI [Desulfotignum balticum]|uniref:Flagellar P-ring protein n=1 Tax=Desulfotignum balticum TaxID=115781 RepID=A0A931CUR5_9BACT|nr:flagellar basal body P-ring protein FlgI [Desulfotignum balticum]
MVVAVVCVVFCTPLVSDSARIKDIVSIQGVRPNQLFGYGLVIGLNGSGDKSGTEFTLQGLANMLERNGIRVNAADIADIKVKNVAAVLVSATLPPFARIGKKIDVTVSSIGDAKSLSGGTLVLTPLKGVDNQVYALAQGPLVVGGFSFGGNAGGGQTKNHPTVARITGGATVEREVPVELARKESLVMILNNPDFNTASAISRTIDREFGPGSAMAIDSSTLEFKVPPAYRHRVVDLIAQMGILEITTDRPAKIIINERTGTVVIGENVRIASVAIAHGNLAIEIKEETQVSQPAPFAPSSRGGRPVQVDGTVVAPGGSTVVAPDSDVYIMEEDRKLMVVNPGNTIDELVKALNAIGVTPRDLITVLQAMKAAGVLDAELEII